MAELPRDPDVRGEIGNRVRRLERMEKDLRTLNVGQVPVWNGTGWDGKDTRIKIHTVTPTTSGPTTTSTADPLTAVVPEMSITADFGGNPIIILAGGSFQHGTVNAGITSEVYDGSTAVGNSRRTTTHPVAAGPLVHAVVQLYTPAAGSRTISWRWKVSAGTGTARGVERHLVIVELRHTA